MNADDLLISKVLVLEEDATARDGLRQLCRGFRLQGLLVGRHNVLSVLAQSVDLGGLFLPEALDGEPHGGLALARQISGLRPELPIFLRRRGKADLDDLPAHERPTVAAVYTLEDTGELKQAIEDHIFPTEYPPRLVRGMTEITRVALQSQFPGLEVSIDPAYLVRDRLVFGELFTLIPLDSDWCRGYLMLQAEHDSLKQCVSAGRTHLDIELGEDFRTLNMILGELTNLIWGGFKNRFAGVAAGSAYLTQVPIVVNHLHRYVSFGSSQPQLCIRCTLRDREAPEMPPVVIHQRLVFNLNWSPEQFRENDLSVGQLVDSGELELF
jgi:Chemotaxis phosphatase CheX